MSLYEKRSASAKKQEVHNALAKVKPSAKPFPVYGKNSFATAVEGFLFVKKEEVHNTLAEAKER